MTLFCISGEAERQKISFALPAASFLSGAQVIQLQRKFSKGLSLLMGGR